MIRGPRPIGRRFVSWRFFYPGWRAATKRDYAPDRVFKPRCRRCFSPPWTQRLPRPATLSVKILKRDKSLVNRCTVKRTIRTIRIVPGEASSIATAPIKSRHAPLDHEPRSFLAVHGSSVSDFLNGHRLMLLVCVIPLVFQQTRRKGRKIERGRVFVAS